MRNSVRAKFMDFLFNLIIFLIEFVILQTVGMMVLQTVENLNNTVSSSDNLNRFLIWLLIFLLPAHENNFLPQFLKKSVRQDDLCISPLLLCSNDLLL